MILTSHSQLVFVSVFRTAYSDRNIIVLLEPNHNKRAEIKQKPVKGKATGKRITTLTCDWMKQVAAVETKSRVDTDCETQTSQTSC